MSVSRVCVEDDLTDCLCSSSREVLDLWHGCLGKHPVSAK